MSTSALLTCMLLASSRTCQPFSGKRVAESIGHRMAATTNVAISGTPETSICTWRRPYVAMLPQLAAMSFGGCSLDCRNPTSLQKLGGHTCTQQPLSTMMLTACWCVTSAWSTLSTGNADITNAVPDSVPCTIVGRAEADGPTEDATPCVSVPTWELSCTAPSR